MGLEAAPPPDEEERRYVDNYRTLLRLMTERVKISRAQWVETPFGRTFGEPVLILRSAQPPLSL